MTINQSPLQSVVSGIAFVIIALILVWDTDIMSIVGILFAVLGTMLLTTGVLRLMGKDKTSNLHRIIDLKKEDFTDIFRVRK